MRRKLRIVQMVSDHLEKPITKTKILDLASLEGDFAAEFAARGATVTAIEGREINIKAAKERFPSDNPKYKNLEFIQDDVRNLSPAKYGKFDVVLCLGILYHLDTPDCFKFIKSIANVCTDFAIIDTHIGISDERVTFEGHNYFGWRYSEYAVTPTDEIQENSRWASINNTKSFWPTKASLVNALIDAGFSTVYECQYPAWNDMPGNRIALIATKKKREKLHNSLSDREVMEEMVEETPIAPTVMNSNHAHLLREDPQEPEIKIPEDMSEKTFTFSINQKILNIIGAAMFVSCVLGLGYYFATEFKREKAEILKHQRMLFIKDSLQVEESLINLKQLHEMENETDTVMFRPRF
jgi:hypothetical protein